MKDYKIDAEHDIWKRDHDGFIDTIKDMGNSFLARIYEDGQVVTQGTFDKYEDAENHIESFYNLYEI